MLKNIYLKHIYVYIQYICGYICNQLPFKLVNDLTSVCLEDRSKGDCMNCTICLNKVSLIPHESL